jgi:hypothetical protein
MTAIPESIEVHKRYPNIVEVTLSDNAIAQYLLTSNKIMIPGYIHVIYKAAGDMQHLEKNVEVTLFMPFGTNIMPHLLDVEILS